MKFRRSSVTKDLIKCEECSDFNGCKEKKNGANYHELKGDKFRLGRVTTRSANSLFLLLRTSVCVKYFVVCTVLLCACCVSAKEQKFAIEPQDQTAVVGARVTLPCRVENKAGQLQWTKDDFGLGTHRHLVGYDRYKMIGSDDEGDYSLDIRDVTLDDDALYQCQVSSGPRGEPAIRSRYARLQVLTPPDPPRILQGSSLQVVEDTEVELECISANGKPPAEITWVDSEGGVLTRGITYYVEPNADGRRFSARSILRLRPRRQHHNQTFSCQAQNTADRNFRATQITLQVQYAPKVKINIKSNGLYGRLQEGNTIVFGCQAHANPSELSYKWYIDNDLVVGDVSNELIIKNVSRKLGGATVKCEVSNAVGKSAETKTLEISYGPSFTVKPQSVEVEEGTTVTLRCAVDSHPPAKVVWLQYEHDKFIRLGKSENLTMVATRNAAGQYLCRAVVDRYPDIEVSANIYVKGPPKITSNMTQYGAEGDSVRVECITFSVPRPDYIGWSFAGVEINTFQNQEYAFLEESLSDGLTKSTLIIRASEAKHFGVYNCSVINAYGSDSVQINLLPDKSLPLLFIVSGCSTATILMLIVMFMIMICHRNTRRADTEKKPDITDVKTDPYKDSDRSSNISDLKLELRQVEGSCRNDNSNSGSDTELHHQTSNLGAPLPGPVSLPHGGYDHDELVKQYQRYSGDFNQALNFKHPGQSNGYVQYVDYSRDYAPPSDCGDLSRSTEGSLGRHPSCGRFRGIVGPDVIPMTSPAPAHSGDVRFVAAYGNPYLRGSGPLVFATKTENPTAPAPPPYCTVRSSNLHSKAGSISSSSSLSKPVSSMASLSSRTEAAQPQVPKTCQQGGGGLYVLPTSSHINAKLNQISVKSAKGNGKRVNGTHV